MGKEKEKATPEELHVARQRVLEQVVSLNTQDATWVLASAINGLSLPYGFTSRIIQTRLVSCE